MAPERDDSPEQEVPEAPAQQREAAPQAADEAPEAKTTPGPTASEPAAAAPEPTPPAAKPAAAKAADAAGEVPAAAAPPPPPPSPDTCRGIAIGQQAFEQAVLAGEYEGSDYLFYLEPAGVLNAKLVCSRQQPTDDTPAGILMTKAARDAKTVFFDDGVNPDKYELQFPKEFGYVKSIQHFQPHAREHEKYPWSKKY